jgi:hypothetical protein
MIGDNYRNLLRRMELIPKEKTGHDSSQRYGCGAHEFRDVARTYLHTRGKQEGLDELAVEFFMGHTSSLDRMKHDKFYEDREYMLSQYKIAEPLLNIVSNPNPNGIERDEIEALRAQNEELRKKFESYEGVARQLSKLRHDPKRLAKLWGIAESGPMQRNPKSSTLTE